MTKQALAVLLTEIIDYVGVETTQEEYDYILEKINAAIKELQT